MCGEKYQLPPPDEWKQKRRETCENDDCSFLSKCERCNWKNYLTRYCECSCDNCNITEMHEVEVVEDRREADFGLTGVSRIPKDQRWNPALGEYCLTTGDVEKYRKKKGLSYVPDDDPPRPYQPDDSKRAKEKRKESFLGD